MIDLICESFELIQESQIRGAWDHALSFFGNSINRLPVACRRILDHVHTDDEKESAAIAKFKEWGIEYLPEAITAQADAGLDAEREAVKEAESSQGPAKEIAATLHDKHAPEQNPNGNVNAGNDDDDDD
eukprot:ANDGO_04840.mRNA.1 hypothetical protein